MAEPGRRRGRPRTDPVPTALDRPPDFDFSFFRGFPGENVSPVSFYEARVDL
jgi:hypothetical protein